MYVYVHPYLQYLGEKEDSLQVGTGVTEGQNAEENKINIKYHTWRMPNYKDTKTISPFHVFKPAHTYRILTHF